MTDTGEREKDVYSFYRDEIKREDEITHHRMTTCMAFQGFLFAAQTFLISGPWTISNPERVASCAHAFDPRADCDVALVQDFRVAAIAAIGFVGYLAAGASLTGIIASRISIYDVKKKFADWRENLDESSSYKQGPQIHGQDKAFSLGNGYTVAVPMLIGLVWALYLGIYVWLVLHRNWYEALGTFLIFSLGLLITRWWAWRKPGSKKEESSGLASPPSPPGTEARAQTALPAQSNPSSGDGDREGAEEDAR